MHKIWTQLERIEIFSLQYIKIFNKESSIHNIQKYFNNEKKPFVVKNVFDSKIDLDFLENNFEKEIVPSLNPNSHKELLSIETLIEKIKDDKKYRLRANTKLGNKISQHIDTSYIKKIKVKIKPFLIT